MTHIALTQLSLLTYVAVLSFLFAAGTTKGLIGVGMPTIAVPLLNLVLDLPATVALLSIPLILTNIPQAIEGDPLRAVLKRLAPIFLGLVLGVFIGITLLAAVRSVYLKPIVGMILISIAGAMLVSPCVRVPRHLEPVASPAAGIIGGLTGGLAASPGPFVFLYLIALGIERDRFVQYASMFLIVAATLMTLTLGGEGLLTRSDAVVSAIASAPIFAGMWVGRRVRHLLSQELFRKLIIGLVVTSGLLLVTDNLRFGLLSPQQLSRIDAAPGNSSGAAIPDLPDRPARSRSGA